MFKERRQRFLRLLKLRQRALDEGLAELGRRKSALRETRLQLERAQAALREAASQYRLPPGQSRRADAFVEAGAWLQDRVGRVELALVQQDNAKTAHHRAALAVQKAERDKRQIETLLERLAEEERLATNRREQVEQDELAARAMGR